MTTDEGESSGTVVTGLVLLWFEEGPAAVEPPLLVLRRLALRAAAAAAAAGAGAGAARPLRLRVVAETTLTSSSEEDDGTVMAWEAAGA